MDWWSWSSVTLHNYCPCVRETWRFVRPRQVIIPEGVILHVEGEQIVMLPSYKGNNCFIINFSVYIPGELDPHDVLLCLINIQSLIKSFDWFRACHVQGNILQCYPVMLPSDVIPCNVTLWRHFPPAHRAAHSSVKLSATKKHRLFQYSTEPGHSETYKRLSEDLH